MFRVFHAPTLLIRKWSASSPGQGCSAFTFAQQIRNFFGNEICDKVPVILTQMCQVSPPYSPFTVQNETWGNSVAFLRFQPPLKESTWNHCCTALAIVLTSFGSPALSRRQELCNLNDHTLYHHWVRSVRERSHQKNSKRSKSTKIQTTWTSVGYFCYFKLKVQFPCSAYTRKLELCF